MKTVDSARAGTLVVIGLNSAFIALDWLVHPARFAELLSVRLALDVAMLVVYWALPRHDPFRVLLAGLYFTGFAMLAFIGLAGGATSNYWPGMMILFLGIPVVLPLSVREVGTVVTTLSLGFVGLPFLTGETMSLSVSLVPMFFVCGAAFECVASTAALERLRLQDFDQRRKLEEARDHLREMDEIKARFTANVHHELRTPLTLTLAPVEALLAGEFGDLSAQQRSYLQTVQTNALRLLRLINNLLDLAKIESSQLEIRRRAIDVPGLVRGLVQGAVPLAEKKGVMLSLVASPDVPTICADPEALEKVTMNLLGNALKFTTYGDDVVVSIERGSEGGVLCRVKDSGVGLPQDQLERIFDRFAQVDISETRKHEGTGIGLALTKELIGLHGGQVWAESGGIGEGATISFWLPVGHSDEGVEEALLPEEDQGGQSEYTTRFAAELGPQQEGAVPGHYGEIERTLDRDCDVACSNARMRVDSGRPRVLICEDNADMRRLLRDLVSKEFDVQLVENGRLGLEAVREESPDLVLTDVMMPEMSGIELCASLKGDPETAGIPVVLVTSKAERDMKIEGLENGADDYVTKPFHARELLARVRSLVKLRRMSTEVEEQNAALEGANRELATAMAELKDAESQIVRAERLSAVGELAAGLAHEVNNPVNFALNASRTLGTYVLDLRREVAAIEAAIHSAESIEHQGDDLRVVIEKGALEEAAQGIEELSGIISEGLDRTSRLVGDLRDFAAPGGGERSPVDLERTVDSALQLTRYFLQKKGVDVEVLTGDSIPTVPGDARALGQVVLNILKNAAEAFETHGGRLCLELREEDDGVLLTVADNGPGIHEGVMDRLFEPFVTTKSGGTGTGLGLSICKRVVDEHHGRLEVRSAPGAGAEFRVWLPLEVSGGG